MKPLVLSLVILMSGCSMFGRDDNNVSFQNYRSALTKVRSNLVVDIAPTYSALVSESDKPQEWKDAKSAVFDATIRLIDDTLAGSKAGE